MATQWTPAQKLAIDSRDGTLLVSAAAGSGKTAVLVQRMIDRITAPDHPGSIDRILMVTFSRKAAGEMRTRVHKALSDLLLQDPGNT
ncbi:MAG: UvrD-helicase domain-containing protein, partial [Acutalibacteraceae bacterium]